jgi:hypothetical protein
MIPSVDHADPSSLTTFQNPVSVVTTHTTFLRVPVDQPLQQFHHIQDLIFHFTFPHLARPLPLTALQQLLSLKLIFRIRPLLAFQPLSDSHSAALDMQIAHKVHDYLGMPFHFNSSLLFLPIHLQGFGFPSIACINSSLAMSGLQRDLNHHIATC